MLPASKTRLHIIEDNSTGNFYTPEDKNIVYYNSFKKANIHNVFKSFSLKYVLKGVASYEINSGLYKITSDSVLVAPAQPGKVYFNEEEEVIVLCVSVNEALITEAYNLYKERFSFDNLLDGYFKYPCFIEALHKKDEVDYLHLLRSLGNTVSSGRALPFISEDWFFNLSEKVVGNEFKTLKVLADLSSQKLSTRKELLVRLNTAKAFMNEAYLKGPSINTIAREAALSQFHFYRSFKEAFHITPHQYMQCKRLKYAKKLLAGNNQCVSSVSAECGFGDIASFSKAFKKQFGESPSGFAKK